MYIIIDNFDSFTYNLFQYFSELTTKPIRVFRNNTITVKEIEKMEPEALIISPGPGGPLDAGISLEAIKYFAGKIPILGVCLGHQCIGHGFGGRIISAQRIVHGKVEPISHDGQGLFRNLPSPAPFTRYHSLAIEKATLPDCLEITATANDGEIMGVRHKEFLIEGVQFHPESIASEHGKKLLKNFLNYRRESTDIKTILNKIMHKQDLDFAEAEGFMEEVTEGDLNKSQIAAFLASLSTKGITPDELAGTVSVLRRKKKEVIASGPLLDIVGTGGDELGTFNISSMSALIAASCGAYVAKHGNRGVSSKSGSADFYRSMGINIELTPLQASQLLQQTSFTFLFAPLFHGAMKHAGPVRAELALKTLFNLLGPLSNPANAQYQLIGVYDEDYCLLIARAARLLGTKKIMVVHGKDGLDEISVSGPTRIVEINEQGEEKDYIFDPAEQGLKLYDIKDLIGGTPQQNVQLAMDLLNGQGREAIKESVQLNTGAALYIYGLASSLLEGYHLAKQALESGKVKCKIEEIIATSNQLPKAEPIKN